MGKKKNTSESTTEVSLLISKDKIEKAAERGIISKAPIPEVEAKRRKKKGRPRSHGVGPRRAPAGTPSLPQSARRT